MTTYISFQPNSLTPFSFRASVGGTMLNATVPWNLYSNRYYLKLVDGQGNAVGYEPLVASPDGYDINLALPYAPGKLVYRASTGQFEAS